MREALIAFFETARRCVDYIEQRSGLLMPDATDSYVFARLTLQEHCAGHHVALNTGDPVALVMQQRADDRWREPILLGLGLVHPAVLNRLLTDLLDREESGQPQTRAKVDRLQHAPRQGLSELLSGPAQPLPVAERVRAGFLLGDPRVPVTIDDWRAALARAQAGDTSGYFCRVEAGTYTIGSADAEDAEQPQHTVTFDAPFLIARYPITNAQWRMWVEQVGGTPSFAADDSDVNRPNQPVVRVTWHMCNAFCAWLSAQLGAPVRMPTEEECEAAARQGCAPLPLGRRVAG